VQKFRNQRLGPKIAAVMTAKAAAAAKRYQPRSGAAVRTGCTVEMVSAKSIIPWVGFEATVTRDAGTAKRGTDETKRKRLLKVYCPVTEPRHCASFT
jgi:hypothetical protein